MFFILGLKVASVELCNDVGLVVLKLAAQILDLLLVIRTSFAVHLSTNTCRYKQTRDLLCLGRGLCDGLEHLLCHLVLEVWHVMDRVRQSWGLLWVNLCVLKAHLLLAKHELVLCNFLDIVTLVETAHLVSMLSQSCF